MSSTSASRYLFAVLLSVLTSGVLAQSTDTGAVQKADVDAAPIDESPFKREPIPEYVNPGLVRRSIIIVDDAQQAASERFGNFMGQVDGFFSNAGSDADAVSNGSWARIRLDADHFDGAGFEADPSVKIRAVLPETERKLKLLVSTEDEDAQDLGDAQTVSQQRGQSASLALRFVRSARENGDIDLDIGVRQRDGEFQYFGRLNTRFRLDFGNDWAANAANSYRHFNKSGFENTLSFDFRRLLYNRDNLFFRTYTDFFWEKQQKGAVIGHATGIYWQVDSHRSFAFEGLAGYHTSLNSGISDRFQGHEIRIRWRHNIWRPWFFYEIWPSIGWPSSAEYRQVDGIFLRAEVIIGQTQ